MHGMVLAERTGYAGRREVDFLVARDGKPWQLAECKTSETPISPALPEFGRATKAPHVVQVVFDLPYEEVDCFARGRLVGVPARTFLTQLT